MHSSFCYIFISGWGQWNFTLILSGFSFVVFLLGIQFVFLPNIDISVDISLHVQLEHDSRLLSFSFFAVTIQMAVNVQNQLYMLH